MAVVDEMPNRLHAGLVALIVGLNVDGDDPRTAIGPRVFAQHYPDEAGLSYPGVVVLPGDREGLADFKGFRGTTEHRYRVWPFKVVLLEKVGPRDHAKLPQLLAWRKLLVDALDQKRPLVGLHSAWCDVEPLPLTERDVKKFQHATSAWLCRFLTRELRD